MVRKCHSERKPQSALADWGYRALSTKLEPSLHFESRFSVIQLLVVEQPSPLACVAYNIFGESPAKLSLDFVFCAEVILLVTFVPGFARQDLFENAELATNEAQSDQQLTCESPSVFRKQSKRIVQHNVDNNTREECS